MLTSEYETAYELAVKLVRNLHRTNTFWVCTEFYRAGIAQSV
jgi:hypothetical protein